MLARYLLVVIPCLFIAVPADGQSVPTEVQLPGTQPLEVSLFGSPTQCDNCHGGYDPAVEPARGWRGSMMAHAGRNPLFWATVAIAEQGFPGVGDLCIRCHSPRGWFEGRSVPTDGSGLTAVDGDGVECTVCHKMANPDSSEHSSVQTPPFLAYGGSPAEGFYGSGMLALNDSNNRLGPYNNAGTAPHSFLQSQFHRSADMCGSCHDVSNSVTGDLAHNNGAPVPLAPGSFSGVPGAPVAQKAAFNNPPYAYGVVERTYSEHKASALSTTPVSAYMTLPIDIRDGAIETSWQASLGAGQGGDYADGTIRYFSCQTCHMRPTTGKGCDRNNAPVRDDLPLHDLTGGGHWVPEAILYLDGQGALVLGGGLTSEEITALSEGAVRSTDMLEDAAALEVNGNSVRITNLTGHKLITGYPEGRRMWLNVKWRDAAGQIVREDGAYGTLNVTMNGSPLAVETILDLSGTNTRIYEAKPGMTQEWAAQLLALGTPPSLALKYDRTDGSVTTTLGQLAAQAPGTAVSTFHFALNNTIVSDNRIPPYGMDYDAAVTRNVRPVPESLFGAPGSGGTYDHFDDVMLQPPANATSATIDLLYQATSWEYIQFLAVGNDGSVSHLATTGSDLMSAWLQTGMAAPVVMSSETWTGSITASATPLGTGCGGAGTPVLTVTPPVLGTTAMATLTQATPSAAGVLGASAPPPASIPIGAGCEVQVDLATWFTLAPLSTDSSGDWTLSLALPPDPALAGFTLVLQAYLPGTAGPFGFDLSNGVLVVLGN